MVRVYCFPLDIVFPFFIARRALVFFFFFFFVDMSNAVRRLKFFFCIERERVFFYGLVDKNTHTYTQLGILSFC